MSKRRGFSGELKAKIALEVVRGDRTLQEIAPKHQAGRMYVVGRPR